MPVATLMTERERLYQEDLRLATEGELQVAKALQTAAFAHSPADQERLKGRVSPGPVYIRMARALFADKSLKVQVGLRLMNE